MVGWVGFGQVLGCGAAVRATENEKSVCVYDRQREKMTDKIELSMIDINVFDWVFSFAL